jgi:developmental checkpoint coupling sporulation initiation to replication initiation
MMRLLSNEILLESYYRALELRLDEEFIGILLTEIRHRKLHIRRDSYLQAQ